MLRKEWDITKTALQNLEKLGLSRRPLALRQNGGLEKQVDGENAIQDHNDNASSSEDDAYASEDDNEDNATMDAEDEDNAQPEAGPSNPAKKDKTSKDIPKGFARIVRDEQGNVIDVIMSAYDEPDVPEIQPEQAEGAQEEVDEDQETPWGKRFSSKEHEKKLRKAAEPVPAKSAALRRKFVLPSASLKAT